MDKITFTHAAQELRIHTNTLKNWQKAGRLPSAEKLKVKGKDVWFVDLDEALDVSHNEQTIYQTTPNTQPTTQEPTDEPQQPTTAAFEQSLVLWQETFTAPLLKTNADLLKSNDDKSKHIEELASELATVKERLRALQASQPLPQPPPGPAVAAPVDNAPTAGNGPQPVKRGLWARLFGG